MSQNWTRYLPLVGATMELFGSPAGYVGSVATAEALSGLRRPAKLEKFAEVAAQRLAERTDGEAREVGEADREVVVERVAQLLVGGSRRALLGAAMLGPKAFREALIEDGTVALAGMGFDGSGYLTLVVREVYGMVLEFAKTPEMLSEASHGAVLHLNEVIRVLPTGDEMLAAINLAVQSALSERPRQLILGERPRLAAGFLVREEMTALRAALEAEGTATVCALEGMRGVGKTQLASAYAEECEEAGWAFVGWVSATSRGAVITQLADMARRSQATDQDDPAKAASDMVVWLNGAGPGGRLLVFDNVEDAEDLNGLIPRGPGMRVIATATVQPTLEKAVEVGVFSVQQAVDYLTTATSIDNKEGAASVAENLGRLPVAITQAASAIVLLGLDFSDYLGLLARENLDRVVHREQGAPYPEKVGAALQIAYMAVLRRMVEQGGTIADASQHHLDALSLLAQSGVARAWLVASGSDEIAGRQALGELIRANIVIVSQDSESVSLHRLLGQVIREDNAQADRCEESISAAVTVLVRARPEGGGYPAQRNFVRAMCVQLAELDAQEHSQPVLRQSRISALSVKIIARALEFDDPHSALRLAPHLGEMHRGLPPNPITLFANNSLGVAYRKAGLLDRAMQLHENVVDEMKQFHGELHSETLAVVNNLAMDYVAAGQPHRAIELHERNLAALREILDDDDPRVLAASNNLATAYQEAGDDARAIFLFEQTLKDRTLILGVHATETLDSKNNLACAYQDIGDLAKAIPLYEQTLAEREELSDPDDPALLRSISNLANAYCSNGEPSRAMPLHERALREAERLLDPSHPHIFAFRHNLAKTLQSLGLLDRAIPLFNTCVADRSRVLGPRHPDTLTSRDGVAGAYQLAGVLDRAIAMFEQNLVDRTAVLGAGHPSILKSLRHLAGAHAQAGNHALAVQLSVQTVAGAQQAFGPFHPNTFVSRIDLALTYRAAGCSDQAKELSAQIVRDAETAAQGAAHPVPVLRTILEAPGLILDEEP